MIISANFNLRISSKTRIYSWNFSFNEKYRKVFGNFCRNRFKHSQNCVKNFRFASLSSFETVTIIITKYQKERKRTKGKCERVKSIIALHYINKIRTLLCHLPVNTRATSNMYTQRTAFLQTLMIFSDTVGVAVAPPVFSKTSSVNVIVLHLVSSSVDLWKERFAKKLDNCIIKRCDAKCDRVQW